MAGAGAHLHAVVKQYTGQDYKPGCGCRELAGKMDAHPPQWSLDNLKMIVGKLRGEARRRNWWLNIAMLLPGTKRPIVWMVKEAVRRAQEDLNNERTS